jgi:hypothetical protein
MASVYSNCAICLAGTVSSDSEGGCFHTEPVPIEIFSSTRYLPDVGTWQVYARPMISRRELSEARTSSEYNTRPTARPPFSPARGSSKNVSCPPVFSTSSDRSS